MTGLTLTQLLREVDLLKQENTDSPDSFPVALAAKACKSFKVVDSYRDLRHEVFTRLRSVQLLLCKRFLQRHYEGKHPKDSQKGRADPYKMDYIKAALEKCSDSLQECFRLTNYIESLDLVAELKGVKHSVKSDAVFIDKTTFK